MSASTAMSSSIRINGLSNSQFGKDLAVADLNNDTHLDILISAPGLKKIFIFYGKPNRWDKPTQMVTLAASNADQTIELAQDGFGSILKVGDVNGDGKIDLIIGASGKAYVYP
ncbi:MAG: hypothetical protein A3G92_02250 [Deltaproteobacteria bacterium RIFCSPLOWO2_12_FULL_38_8]|nr:MAG: hypothetical protein A3G92_02250 [Deltaproteobacteria bacterium RIFCSPLOWO2_12_FULL_38_8]